MAESNISIEYRRQKDRLELRKKRAEALEELAKIRPKISLLESRCELLSYRQGELFWESMIQRVKTRKWKANNI